MGLIIELPKLETQHAKNLSRLSEIIVHPLYKDFPGKVETDRYGNVITMAPPTRQHDKLAFEVAKQVDALLGKTAFAQMGVSTSDGIKVMDAGWVSPERDKAVGDAIAYTIAPEICIEVMSPSNSEVEMAEKRALYFEAGAEEVWLVSGEGNIRFYKKQAQNTVAKSSNICADFPHEIGV